MKMGKQKLLSAALVMALAVGSISGEGVADAAKNKSYKMKYTFQEQQNICG